MARNAKGRSDREVAKAIALDLPDVELASHHGTLDMRVGNRIFATFPAEGTIIKLKSAGTGKGWLEVAVEDVDRDTLQRLMIEAWLFAAPPRLREIYGARLEGRK